MLLEVPKFPFPAILLHPPLPKCLWGVNPRTIKGEIWWNRVRAQAYAKHAQHCWACGIHKNQAKSKKWLEAHECYHVDWEHGTCDFTGVVALCHYCHNFIHRGRLELLVSQKKVSTKTQRAILNHGIGLLKGVLYTRTVENWIRKSFGETLESVVRRGINPPPQHKWDIRFK